MVLIFIRLHFAFIYIFILCIFNSHNFLFAAYIHCSQKHQRRKFLTYRQKHVLSFSFKYSLRNSDFLLIVDISLHSQRKVSCQSFFAYLLCHSFVYSLSLNLSPTQSAFTVLINLLCCGLLSYAPYPTRPALSAVLIFVRLFLDSRRKGSTLGLLSAPSGPLMKSSFTCLFTAGLPPKLVLGSLFL